MEISYLSDKKIKVMVINMLTKLGRIDEPSKNSKKEREKNISNKELISKIYSM